VCDHGERVQHKLIRIRHPQQCVEQLDGGISGRDGRPAVSAAPAEEYVAEQRDKVAGVQRVPAVGAKRAALYRADSAWQPVNLHVHKAADAKSDYEYDKVYVKPQKRFQNESPVHVRLYGGLALGLLNKGEG